MRAPLGAIKALLTRRASMTEFKTLYLVKQLALLLLLMTIMPYSAAAPKPPVILVIGDSLSAGYGLAKGEGWVDLLKLRLQEKQIDANVINASITGETSRGGLQRLPQLLQTHQPDLTIIELGANDGLRGFSPDVTYNNLAEMIKSALEVNSRVLLAGVRLPVNYGKSYRQAFTRTYTRLNEDFDIDFVPYFLLNVGENIELMQSDGIHPSAEAQSILLNNVWPQIIAIINEIKSLSG